MPKVLITGCSSGIGLDAARTMQARGWTVIATCRKPADLAARAAEGMIALPLDLADPASVEAAAAAAIAVAATLAACSKGSSGSDGAGGVYFLNFKPESEQAFKDIAAAYTKKTGVNVKVVTAASGTYEQTLKTEIAKSNPPTLFNLNGPVGYGNWKEYASDLSDADFTKQLTDESVALKGDEGKIVGVPLAVVLMAACWFLLTKVLFKPEIDEIPGGRKLIDDELAKLGTTSAGERRVLVIFVLAAVITGIAGALYYPQAGIINPAEIAPIASIYLAVWVAIGGRGRLYGAVIGAALLAFLRARIHHAPDRIAAAMRWLPRVVGAGGAGSPSGNGSPG